MVDYNVNNICRLWPPIISKREAAGQLTYVCRSYLALGPNIGYSFPKPSVFVLTHSATLFSRFYSNTQHSILLSTSFSYFLAQSSVQLGIYPGTYGQPSNYPYIFRLSSYYDEVSIVLSLFLSPFLKTFCQESLGEIIALLPPWMSEAQVIWF